jgi:S-adenosylmethionine-diacylglycerol 3-amino-3-carboxypropyl transferase
MLRLKLAAAMQLPAWKATGFLGGLPANDRVATLASLNAALPGETARFWNDRLRQVKSGVLAHGRIERYFAVLRWVLGWVHSRSRIDALFEQPTLKSQRSYYRDRWDTRGWRRLFLLAHKRILDRALDPSFYRHVEARNLPEELRERAERCMTVLPLADNYFLSWILRGRYPGGSTARPPYLLPGARKSLLRSVGGLETHHADIREFLRSRPDSSCDKFYLSNVAEWLPEEEVAAFFEEVIRVARDGAVVCYRALMVDRPLPAALADRLQEDAARSAALSAGDRAFVNAGFHVVTVRKRGARHG